jgi:hypothetical protein
MTIDRRSFLHLAAGAVGAAAGLAAAPRAA